MFGVGGRAGVGVGTAIISAVKNEAGTGATTNFAFQTRPVKRKMRFTRRRFCFIVSHMPTSTFIKSVLLLTLLFFCGCERQDISVEREQPHVIGVSPSITSSEKSPSKADLPKSELSVASSGYLIDGFEGPENTVWAFDSADDEGNAQYVTDGVTQGKKALQITLRDKGKTGKFNLRRDVALDLSHAASLLVDFTASSDTFTLAVSLTCGPHDVYQESKIVELKKGPNKNVRIPLSGNTWKNEKTKWEFNGPPVNLQSVQRVCLLIFTNGESSGSVLIDNLRVEPDETPLLSSGAMVHREWRPELLGVMGIPKVVPQYQGVEAYTFFRASYRDFFDYNDIATGIRIYTPSGKTLDVRGFFAGMMRAPKEVSSENDAEAVPPLWGPIDLVKPADGGDGAKKKRKKAAKAEDRKDEKKEPEKEEPKDPVKEAKVKEQIELTSALRIKTTTLLPVWGMRFTPLETGQYTLQVYVRNSAGETRTEESKLTVVPEIRNPKLPGRWGGNVRVSKRDPRQFELSNGDPFFVYGQNVCWTRDWSPYLDRMKDYGANTMRIWLCPWGLNLERKTDPGSYDLETAKQIDKLVAECETKGIRLIFCFTFHGMTQSNWGDSPYNWANGGPCGRPEEFFTNWKARSQFKRLLSYAAARWGSSPAILSWELMNEIDLAKWTWQDEAINWAREMAGHLKSVDAHGHMVTVSATLQGAPLELWSDSRIDWIQIHSYGTDVANLFFERMSPLQNLPKPMLMGEFGGGTESRDDIPDKDGARLQAALWLTACSPSCGAAMPWWWDTYIEARNLYPVMAAAKKFTDGEDRRNRYGLWVRKMYPGNVEVSGIMDAQGGRFYVHKPEWTSNPDTRKIPMLAKSQTIELSGINDGAYALEYWDAKEGKIFSTQDALARDGKLTITLSAHDAEYGIKLDRKVRVTPGLK